MYKCRFPRYCGLIQPQDFARVASQQPLKWNELPWYLYEEVHPLVRPPKLWCGWRVDEEDLLRIASAKCPEVIYYTGMGNPDPLEMLMDNEFPRKICELCQIPEEDWDLVQTGMVFVAKTNGIHDPDIVITCGSTTNGVVGDAERARMADFIADGAEPQWHLDYIKWRWEPGKRESCCQCFTLSPC